MVDALALKRQLETMVNPSRLGTSPQRDLLTAIIAMSATQVSSFFVKTKGI